MHQIITKSVQVKVHLGLWCLEMFHQGLLDPSMWKEERVYLCLGVVVYVYSHKKIAPNNNYKECAVVNALERGKGSFGLWVWSYLVITTISKE